MSNNNAHIYLIMMAHKRKLMEQKKSIVIDKFVYQKILKEKMTSECICQIRIINLDKMDDLHNFAISYNILRIMSGLGGLRYAQ